MKRLLLPLLVMLASLTGHATVPIYVWQGWDDAKTSAESLRADFGNLKRHGAEGVCFNAGFNLERIRIAAQEAKRAGLVFHAWIPCMLQGDCPREWYAVNRLGQSAKDAPAYVPYYTCLDPHNKAVQQYLVEKYAEVARIPGVDFVQLDYIRYVDVILARGLWDKYGLVMNEEYPAADYCYCDDCVADFRSRTGIDIRAAKDPSAVRKWARFRCDVITGLVGKISAAVHAEGKRISADVFPGPRSKAVWMVRQEWNKWDVDAVFPMNYNDFYLEPPAWVGRVTREEVKSMKGRAPIYSGLFICKDWQTKSDIKDPEGWGLLPSEMEQAVVGSLRAGAKGLCLFSADSMTEEHWAALHRALQSYEARQ